MQLAKVLARRHLEQYGDGTDPQLQLETLTRLLEDVYLTGRGTSFNDDPDQPSELALCDAFRSEGLVELRCSRCGHPAWRHEQPVTLSAALQKDWEPDWDTIDGALSRARGS